MGRKRLSDSDALRFDIKTRINQLHFERLSLLLKNSRHRTMAELLREIICDKPIVTYSIDQSLGVVVDELARIRKEINSIGININQVARQFHSATSRTDKLSLLLEVTALNGELNSLTEKLFPIISELAKKWLRG